MTDLDFDSIPRVVLVFNGPLKMSPGKMAAQAFQACQRLLACEAEDVEDAEALIELVHDWEEHTTTIARVAKTTNMFDRVCKEVPGIVMIDEGFTEVDPDTPTLFASWPAPKNEEHKLLSNAKVQLLRNTTDPFDGWTDEQLRSIAPVIEMGHAHRNFVNELAREIIDALRAEAASRHLTLPVNGDFDDIASDQWMT